jgi:hypothetical protein
MKKSALYLIVIVVLTVCGISLSEASESAVAPPISGIAQDDMVTLNRFELDGFAHAVITFNNTTDTAFAVILNPDGSTDTVFFSGYAYLFADFAYHTLYGSPDGSTWYVIGSI